MNILQFVLTAVIGIGGGGFLVAAYKARQERKQAVASTDQTKVETMSTYTEVSDRLVQMVNRELQRTHAKLEEQNVKMDANEKRTEQLEIDLRNVKAYNAMLLREVRVNQIVVQTFTEFLEQTG